MSGTMVRVDIVTLAERPDLAESTFDIPYGPDAGAFMQGTLTGLLTRGRRLSRRWAGYVIAVIDGRGTPVARGVSVPFAAEPDERELYPSGGWDQVAIWAAEDAMDNAPVDTVCALEIAIHGCAYTCVTAGRSSAWRPVPAPSRPRWHSGANGRGCPSTGTARSWFPERSCRSWRQRCWTLPST